MIQLWIQLGVRPSTFRGKLGERVQVLPAEVLTASGLRRSETPKL